MGGKSKVASQKGLGMLQLQAGSLTQRAALLICTPRNLEMMEIWRWIVSGGVLYMILDLNVCGGHKLLCDGYVWLVRLLLCM